MKQNPVFFLLMAALLISPLARAGTKEEIMRLQSDVNDLKNQLRDFDKTYSEKTDGLKSLIVQLNDQVAKSNVLLDRASKMLDSQASGARATDQSLVKEIRDLSARMDEALTRVSALAQQVADLKVQSKALSQGGNSGGANPEDSSYNQAYIDYVQGNFDLAIQEFTAYLSSFPNGPKAPVAQFYLGDAYSSQGKLQQAITSFTRVINDFPSAEQVPSALYKRGRAELAQQESDNAIADFRDIIERFPSASEAERAKEELRKLGVSPTKQPPARDTRRKTK
jgi:tol-pal system protein YbgF